MIRRQFGKAMVAGAVLAGAQRLFARPGSPVRNAKATGPIVGGNRGHIFGGHARDLGAYGYVEEEFFIEGTAQSWHPAGTLGPDGVWTVEPHQQAPYRTRMIVQRPRDPARFNGTVICEWTNVSAGYEISSAVNQQFFRDGFAYAAISAQKLGLDGTPGRGLGLKQWDAKRYGTLDIAGDSFSYDIFSQVAQTLRKRPGSGSTDPMGGLRVRRLFALGESQSAARLLSYINAVHRQAQVFDAFMVVVTVGRSTEFTDFVFDDAKSLEANNNERRARTIQTRIRTDQPVPVLVVNSETETPYYAASRQDDGPWFRFWEVAGATHASALGGGRRPDISKRDGVPASGARWARMVDLLPTLEAAAVGLDRWLSGGAPLPSFPRIEIAGPRNAIQTDPFGNASGGVRLPEVAVPAARYVTQTGDASGRLEPFDAAMLRAIYTGAQDYAERIRAAADWAVAAGLILPRRRDEYVAKAANGPVEYF